MNLWNNWCKRTSNCIELRVSVTTYHSPISSCKVPISSVPHSSFNEGVQLQQWLFNHRERERERERARWGWWCSCRVLWRLRVTVLSFTLHGVRFMGIYVINLILLGTHIFITEMYPPNNYLTMLCTLEYILKTWSPKNYFQRMWGTSESFFEFCVTYYVWGQIQALIFTYFSATISHVWLNKRGRMSFFL